MSGSVQIYDRNNQLVAWPVGLVAAPERWAATAMGGCSDADIRIDGPRSLLFSLVSWLGYQVHIHNDAGVAVWWGDIEEIEISMPSITLGVSLRAFSNRIQIRYTARRPGGSADSADTDWQEDAESVAMYGIYERRLNASQEMRAVEADAQRATALARYSKPARSLRPSAGGGVGGAYATLRCVGYWQRLRRVYYANTSGLIEHDASGTPYPLGLGFSTTRLSWVSSDGNYTVHDIWGRLKNFSYANWQFRVTGTALNDGVKTILSADGKDAQTYSSDFIHFAASDDMYDGNDGFGFISVGDVLLVSGAAQPENNGLRLIKTAGIGHVEASPGWGSGFNNSGGWGPLVTVQRGNSISIAEPVTKENPGPALTQVVTAYGQRMYQSFPVPDATYDSWLAAAVELRLRKVGAPADAVRVRLYTYVGGALADLLATVDIPAADIGDELDWIEFALPSVELSRPTVYAIEVSRSGANDPTNYYEIELDDDAGYIDGVMRVYDGSGWVSPAEAKSLIFRVIDALDTAVQVQRIWQSANVGLGVCKIESESLVFGTQYRLGDMTAFDEANDLLMRGTSSAEHLIALTTPDRHVRIYAEPDALAVRYLLDESGRLRTLHGSPAPDGFLPVGEWVGLWIDYEMPDSWASLSPIYVERAEYRPDGGLSIEPPGDDYEIGIEVG